MKNALKTCLEKNGGTARIFRLSPSQEKCWAHFKNDPSSNYYNLSMQIRLEGVLSVGLLERSLLEIIRQHEALRVRIIESSVGPLQVVTPVTQYQLETIDLRTHPELLRNTKADQLCLQNAQQAFDLVNEPLFKASLIQLTDDENILILRTHQVICDGISCYIFLNELPQIYARHAGNVQSINNSFKRGYLEYIDIQTQLCAPGEAQRQADYWLSKFEGAPLRLEFNDDKTAAIAPSSNRIQNEALILTAEFYSGVKNFCQAHGLTPFMFILGAFEAALTLLTGQNDFLVGSVINHRSELDEETTRMIGDFTNPITFRARFNDEQTILDFLGDIKNDVLGAHSHGTCPFKKVAEEVNARREVLKLPLISRDSINIDFIMHNLQLISHLDFSKALVGKMTIAPTDMGQSAAVLDLAVQVHLHEGGLLIDFQYNAEKVRPHQLIELMRLIEKISQFFLNDSVRDLATLKSQCGGPEV